AAGRDVGDQRALGLLQPQALGQLVVHGLNAHAQPAALRLAEFADLRDHVLGHARGNSKADTDAAAGIVGVDQRVHADHLAVHLEQRAAGVAAVDGGVGLDVVVI